MFDFDIKRCTRKCAATGRELLPGERVYSTLADQRGEVNRLDYAAEAWNGPPPDVLGWWAFVIPDQQSGRPQWAPQDVIREYFKTLVDSDTEADKRYVLALLLVRRRMMRLAESQFDDQGGESLVLYCPKEEVEYQVPVVVPPADRIEAIQDQLAGLLFAGLEEPSH